MPLAVPAELKKIIPFVRRAEELDRDKTSPESRLVAYYCRQYAVHMGIPLASTSVGAKTCLGHLLEELEKEKPAMDNFTRDEASFLCRTFAQKVFNKADGEDRMGIATKETAKTFYASASFLQILEQFSDENDTSEAVADDKKRIIYAKWKATEILRAIKEGRAPTPGGYGETEPDGMDTDDDDAGAKKDAPTSETPEPERGQDAPTTVTTVVEDDSEEEQPPRIPLAPPPLPPPPTFALTSNHHTEENGDEDAGEDDREEGTEVELGPPPAYPGEGPASTTIHPATATNRVDRPKINFNLPPVVPPPSPFIPPPPAPAPKKTTTASSNSNGSGGFLGFGKSKPTAPAPSSGVSAGAAKVTKSQLSDATELTRFALTALESREVDIAVERLQQALQALGR